MCQQEDACKALDAVPCQAGMQGTPAGSTSYIQHSKQSTLVPAASNLIHGVVGSPCQVQPTLIFCWMPLCWRILL